ncbi:MAG: carbon storage regulator [Pseudomonadota bacterium]
MLYLTRKVGEAIIINDVIEVTLIEIQGKSIKLGFQFPDTEKVLRRELHDKIKAETHAAAKDVLVIQQTLSGENAQLKTAVKVCETFNSPINK